MKIVVIVPFRDERERLPVLLRTLEEQARRPDRLVLVDDGSTDATDRFAADFAARRPWAVAAPLVRDPKQPRGVAPELHAFAHGMRESLPDADVIAKLDSDLELPPDFLAAIEDALLADPMLGLVGTHLAEIHDGSRVRMRCPEGHVHGATKFYRAACLEQIWPIPPILGWDTLDELRAEARGWRTRTLAVPSADPVHLRRMGMSSGLLRGYRRAGEAAWGYGASPLGATVGAVARARDRPRLLCGAHYFYGFVAAALRRRPRAEPPVRALARRRLRRQLTRR